MRKHEQERKMSIAYVLSSLGMKAGVQRQVAHSCQQGMKPLKTFRSCPPQT